MKGNTNTGITQVQTLVEKLNGNPKNINPHEVAKAIRSLQSVNDGQGLLHLRSAYVGHLRGNECLADENFYFAAVVADRMGPNWEEASGQLMFGPFLHEANNPVARFYQDATGYLPK